MMRIIIKPKQKSLELQPHLIPRRGRSKHIPSDITEVSVGPLREEIENNKIKLSKVAKEKANSRVKEEEYRLTKLTLFIHVVTPYYLSHSDFTS